MHNRSIHPSSLSTEIFFNSAAWDPKALPGQLLNNVPPALPGSSPGSPTGETCPEFLAREAFRRHSKQMPEPPQLTPLNVEEQWLY